ncbi:MAG: group 1 glycosyl [Geobacteraceae bacterium]|nr:MAG: group 1 glycosyl [Geobacteraceae bacterium]
MKILVLTTVFPNKQLPSLGVFVRERMFRVARHCELKVVAPCAWFPGIRLIKPGYRPKVDQLEFQDGIEVLHPRFFSIPKFFKCLDGIFLFMSSLLTLFRLDNRFRFDIIDAHFVYPDGVGAVLLGKVLRKPVTITVRESNLRGILQSPLHRFQICWALRSADRVFSVCSDLKDIVTSFGVPNEKVTVVPNGVDIDKFKPIDKTTARNVLNLPQQKKIIISVGWLIERKGFHRIISVLPRLRETFPDVLLVIVGGEPSAHSCGLFLKQLVEEFCVQDMVLFAGPKPHGELHLWLSAADIFCLATSGEGWANVFLEAMACGLPVATTKVGGNMEVVCSENYGVLFDIDDEVTMLKALITALRKDWDNDRIIAYAAENTWENRVNQLLTLFADIHTAQVNKKHLSKDLP